VEDTVSTPWWITEAGAPEPAAALTSRVDADVVVVGGGYVGLWTALTLRRRDPDRRVVLVEADRCGHGPSGRNGGFLHGYWSMLAWLRDRLGADDALRVAHAGEGIVPAVRALGDDVWLRESGMLEVETTAAQARAADDAVEVARQLGVPQEAVALTVEEVAARCGSPVFGRGVLFRDGATVHPARLAFALRRHALEAGVELYERTPATRVRDAVVESPEGAVRARDVVLATNAALAHWRPLARRLAEFSSYVVLTEPVPDMLGEIGWTGGEAIADGRMFLHYFRTTDDGRVLMGSAGGTRAHAARGLRRLLPMLSGARVTHDWGGPIDVSADRLPIIGSRGRIHYAAGFTGNGVGPSWLVAQALSSLVLDADDDWSRLPLVNRRVRPLPPEPLKRLGGAIVRASVLALEEADEEGRRPPLAARVGAALPRLTGTRLGLR
jgi:glycine/D-amino acid oxidase-like deaminating enzyme